MNRTYNSLTSTQINHFNWRLSSSALSRNAPFLDGKYLPLSNPTLERHFSISLRNKLPSTRLRSTPAHLLQLTTIIITEIITISMNRFSIRRFYWIDFHETPSKPIHRLTQFPFTSDRQDGEQSKFRYSRQGRGDRDLSVPGVKESSETY